MPIDSDNTKKQSPNECLKNKSGLYIVTLNNEIPISVNANDKRIADKCIHVNRVNCKFGKAKCLQRRHKNYYKVFGEKNTNYHPIILMEEISLAEKLILKRLMDYRLRGQSGRLNEWLINITKEQLILIIVSTLKENNMTFELIDE
jgi:hypothetical protein